MGVVLHLHDPFEPAAREIHKVTRQVSVWRFVRRRRALQRHMTTRTINGPHGKRRARDFRQPTVCLHNGKPVLRANWKKTIIRETDVVTFHAVPRLEGGGGGFNPLGIIIAIAVAVAAPYLAPILAGAVFGAAAVAAGGAFAAGSIGLGLLTAGIGIGLSAIAYGIMSLFVQPPPPTSAQSGGGSFGGTSSQASPTYSLQAQGNSARLGQPIPELFGEHLVYPDFAHVPYQSFIGNEQYLHYLLVVTKGWCTINQVRVGETPVTSFPEITWEAVEPGATVPTALVNPMMLVSADLAQVELTGSEAGSPWKGPFIVNPATTVIETLEIDYIAPEGLYYANNAGGLDARGFTIELELRKIDDDGAPIGGWANLATINESNATRTQLRWTRSYATPSTGRFEARMRRTDAKDTDARAGNSVQWFGLRGIQPGTRSYEDVTLLAVKARATGNLSGASSKQFNCVAIRKLPTWDDDEQEMTTELFETRNPCDAAAYINLAQNGGRLAERQVDLAGIYAHRDDYDSRGWTFDGVFDTSTTCWEALSKVGRCVIAQPIIQGPKVRLVRDLPSAAPVMMFTTRNIAKGSFKLKYIFPDEKTADAVDVEYIDRRSWKPANVIVALPGSTAENPGSLQLFGCTNRAQAREVGFNFARANKLRRRIVPFGTEMEGLMLVYGDQVIVSHDMPRWGQAAESITFDEGTRRLTVDQRLEFAEEGTHYVGLRQRDGTMAGPYEATAVPGNPFAIVLGDGELPELSLGGDAERTQIIFGVGTGGIGRPLKVTGVIPRSMLHADVITIDDDPAMYEPIPPE